MHRDKYKLLVVDIDGTIVNGRGGISPKDAEAIADVMRQGPRVVLSTGRVVQASQWVVEQLGIDGYHIFFDGALVCDTTASNEVYCETIPPDLIVETASFARKQSIYMDYFSSTRYFIEHENWTVDIRRKFFRLEPTVMDYEEVARKERIVKGTLILGSDEDRARAAVILDRFRGRLAFSWTRTPAYPGVDFINVVSPLVSKGKALGELCRLLGIDRSEVVAIGDGVNDVSLLAGAGLAIAMGNCPDELRSVAHVVTLDVDHSGVAEAIRKYLL